jgi:hypothetical protein
MSLLAEAMRIAKLDDASLSSGEGRLRPLGNLAALMLGEGRVNVKQERINVCAKLGHDERDLMRHQAGNEVNARGQRSATRGSAETPSHRLMASALDSSAAPIPPPHA